MIDSAGRNIDYLRISVTDLCNLRCKYCMPKEGVYKREREEILSIEEMKSCVDAFIKLGVKKIRLTGGEPLIRKGILNLIEYIGSKTEIEDFAITTNGLLLEENAKILKDSGLKRVNISLDTLKPDKYKEITRGGDITKVQQGIKEAIKHGLTPIKINTVLVGGFNEDEIEDFVNLTKESDIDIRFIELMPIGEVKTWSKEKFISNQEVLNRVPDLKLLERKKEESSPAVYYKIENSKGKIGLINPISCKFCSNCNRIRLTSRGIIKPCLHSDQEYDIRPYIYNQEELIKRLEEIVYKKPIEHSLEEGHYTMRNMNQIGG